MKQRREKEAEVATKKAEEQKRLIELEAAEQKKMQEQAKNNRLTV